MDAQTKPLIIGAGLALVVAAIGLVVLLTKGAKKSLVALNPEKKIPFKLVDKKIVSHDTRRFIFQLQSPDHILGLPVGNHMYLSATIDDKPVIRPYTPVTSDDEKGFFELVIKVYFKNVHPKFPEGGKMSQYLESLKIGDTVDIRGPAGKLIYKGRGTISIKESIRKPEQLRKAKFLGLIAGGTGITPMLQIIKAVLKDSGDHTTVSLIFANQTERDILVREELEFLASQNSDQFKLWYTLDRPPEDWAYSGGFIDEKMLREHMPPAGPDTQILMCGPPPMINFACIPNLKKLGFTADMYFPFG
ncbi:predicted protein [Nematostella vectensis]|uniref:NADH-cytochrome b5 reductase n=2 Tax=Nematostella vectensis TaxID=45351 RepID=A7S8X8_NEMVE|nr:predicted protein [Nematostella vectensis]|eukprot:XP_001631871.1 predicted protein [Nematostella vectensis]